MAQNFTAFIAVGNLTADSVVRKNSEGKPFTAFSIALERGEGKDTIYPEVRVNGDKVSEFLKKGDRVTVRGTDLERYTYESKGETKTAYRINGAEVYLGDVVLVFAQGHLAEEAKMVEGKEFAGLRLLSNVRDGKDKEALVASSAILGEKGFNAMGKYLTKGKQVAVFGEAKLNAYTGKSGPGSELRFTRTIDIRLGADAKGKAAASDVAVPADATDGMDEIPE